MEGPDHKASAEPEELKALITEVRQVPVILGSAEKVPNKSELKVMAVARKSIVTTAPIREGEVFTEKNLGIKRPGNGIAPKHYVNVIGKKARVDIPAHTLLKESDYVS